METNVEDWFQTDQGDRAYADREYDIIVFGAAGFAGRYVVEELARASQEEPIKWAIAGNHEYVLEDVLTAATKETGINVKPIEVMDIEVLSDDSLGYMASRTRVVLNCVGPFQFLGEPVVKACIETGTHLLDISGEPHYMESMQLKYNKAAKEKGIYIISACGFDSIPADLGVRFLKKNFNGELNSVETFVTVKPGLKGYRVNDCTWESAIHAYTARAELASVRERLYKEVFTKRNLKSDFKLERKVRPFRSEYAKGWCLPFPASDRSVIQRSEQHQYEERNERPIQIQTYFTVARMGLLIRLLLMVAYIYLLAGYKWGLTLLEKHPSFFTFGLFSKKGPTREQIKDTSFKITLVGKGWSIKMSEPSKEPSFPPNKTVIVEVKGKDPTYLTSSTCLVQSGLTVLKESDKMPQNGGVYPPGAAFSNTGLYDRLRKHGLTMDIVYKK